MLVCIALAGRYPRRLRCLGDGVACSSDKDCCRKFECKQSVCTTRSVIHLEDEASKPGTAVQKHSAQENRVPPAHAEYTTSSVNSPEDGLYPTFDFFKNVQSRTQVNNNLKANENGVYEFPAQFGMFKLACQAQFLVLAFVTGNCTRR